MPETTTKLKPLHIADTYDKLSGLFDLDLDSRDAKKLENSIPKLIERAEKNYLDGDEELSFVYYMKTLHIFMYLQKNKIKESSGILCCKEKINEVMNRSEKLKESLLKRYEIAAECKRQEIKEQSNEEEKIRAEDKQRLKDEKAKQKEIVLGEKSITAEQLFCLMNDCNKDLLIIDIRTGVDFCESRMKCKNCINVPEEIIKEGKTAVSLESEMSSESSQLWKLRRNADVIVIVDWSSTEESVSVTQKHINILNDIMVNWDPDTHYKRPSLILEGGYEDWLCKYPTLTTNPHVKFPSKMNGFVFDDLLESIHYPLHYLETEKAETESGKSNSNRNLKSQTLNDGSSNNKLKTMPVVDRSSKSAALEKYEENVKTVLEIPKNTESTINNSVEFVAKIKPELKLSIVNDISGEKLKENKEEKNQISDKEENQRNQEINDPLELLKKKHEKEVNDISSSETVSKRSEKDLASLEKLKIAKEEEEEEEEERRKREQDVKKLREERKEKEKRADNDIYFVPLKNEGAPVSNLKRSRSTSNISQQFQNFDGSPALTSKPPVVERSTKPIQKSLDFENIGGRQRYFNPVYGNPGHGLTGLKNLGNTCYMNSILQCIANTKPLIEFFKPLETYKDVNQSSPTKGEIAAELAAVIQALWSNNYRSICPIDFKDHVGLYKRQFAGYEQQDSHEFLTILMDWLQNDLKKTKKDVLISLRQIADPADKEWYEFVRKNESPIIKWFYGQQMSTVRCTNCHKSSVTYEPFFNLSVPLPEKSNKCSLDECIGLYLREERISGWKCPSCKDFQNAIKKFDIIRLPSELVIHLKRFYSDGWYKKRQTTVDFPLHDLNMSKYLVPGHSARTNYYLYAVSNHYGTMEGGHYTGYCKNPKTDRWHKFDDNEVSEISDCDIRTGAAYILFYRSIQGS